MRAGFSEWKRLELGIVGIEFALDGRKVERLKVERDITPIGPLWKAGALGASHDSDALSFPVIDKKVLQADAEHQSDAQERGERWEKLSAFDLGQHGRGE